MFYTPSVHFCKSWKDFTVTSRTVHRKFGFLVLPPCRSHWCLPPHSRLLSSSSLPSPLILLAPLGWSSGTRAVSSVPLPRCRRRRPLSPAPLRRARLLAPRTNPFFLSLPPTLATWRQRPYFFAVARDLLSCDEKLDIELCRTSGRTAPASGAPLPPPSTHGAPPPQPLTIIWLSSVPLLSL
jgi:hypothetical protein